MSVNSVPGVWYFIQAPGTELYLQVAYQSMTTKLEIYREKRDSFLVKVSETLSQDERFVAVWLTGSYAREEADSVSDIDLTSVVAEPYSETLCERLEQVSHQTSPERYALFSQFGSPALIHENNNNAPPGGTFTFIMYSDSAIMIDWILIPQSYAIRPYQAKLLFNKVNIPTPPAPEPDGLEESQKVVAENWAFFWMMTAITIKYVIRRDDVFVAQWVENLHRIVHEIERRIDREPWTYTRSLSQLQTTRENQIKSIRELSQRMQALQPRVSKFLGFQPVTPLAEIERLFSLASE